MNKSLAFSLLLSLFIFGCSKDDSSDQNGQVNIYQNNLNVTFKFMHQDQEVVYNSDFYTNSNNENLKIRVSKFIISNIKLTKTDGSVYTVPKSESLFIIKKGLHGDENNITLDLPKGEYKKLTFGVGIDKEQYDMGANGQGDFLQQANMEGMIWDWTAGYIYMVYEGKFTSTSVVDERFFGVHAGRTAQNYNYTEHAIELSSNAIVKENENSCTIEIVTDLSKICDGDHKLILTEGSDITGGDKVNLAVENLSKVFSTGQITNN